MVQILHAPRCSRNLRARDCVMQDRRAVGLCSAEACAAATSWDPARQLLQSDASGCQRWARVHRPRATAMPADLCACPTPCVALADGCSSRCLCGRNFARSALFKAPLGERRWREGPDLHTTSSQAQHVGASLLYRYILRTSHRAMRRPCQATTLLPSRPQACPTRCYARDDRAAKAHVEGFCPPVPSAQRAGLIIGAAAQGRCAAAAA